MGRKRIALEDKLSGVVKPKGWADIITTGSQEQEMQEPESKPKSEFAKKTYLLRPAMVEDIARLAEAERVQVNELVRFLLANAMEDLKTGKLQIKAATEVRRILS